MLHPDTTRYRLELDMLERDSALSDRSAIDLLRRDFALAANASYLVALSGDELAINVVSRSFPQEGVARYAVELDLVERASMSDRQAGDLVRRELRRAQNASHFLRIAVDDFRVTLVERVRPLMAVASARS